MQNKILKRTNYTTKIYNNLIELLKVVKKHALNYQEIQYKIAILTDANKAMLTTNKRMESIFKNTHVASKPQGIS
jgi:hypothetical protein